LAGDDRPVAVNAIKKDLLLRTLQLQQEATPIQGLDAINTAQVLSAQTASTSGAIGKPSAKAAMKAVITAFDAAVMPEEVCKACPFALSSCTTSMFSMCVAKKLGS
jgi:hypothetical protein